MNNGFLGDASNFEESVLLAGFQPREVMIRNMMASDIAKIVKNIFNKQFVGDTAIEDRLFSSILNNNIWGFFELTLEIMIFGKKKIYIVDSKTMPFEAKRLVDSDGYILRGKNIKFWGFIQSLPDSIKEDEIDPSLILDIDITKNGSFVPLLSLLTPIYDYWYNILLNLNYSLMVSNTPQLKLGNFRDLSVGAQGHAKKEYSSDFLKKQLLNIKNALKGRGKGDNLIYLDAMDSIDFNLPNMDGYTKANDILQEWIASLLDAPVSYLFGRAPQGMNATGDKDLQQWNNTSRFWYRFVLHPIFDHITGLFGYEPSYFDFTDHDQKLNTINTVSSNGVFLQNAMDNGLIDKKDIQKTISGSLNGK